MVASLDLMMRSSSLALLDAIISGAAPALVVTVLALVFGRLVRAAVQVAREAQEHRRVLLLRDELGLPDLRAAFSEFRVPCQADFASLAGQLDKCSASLEQASVVSWAGKLRVVARLFEALGVNPSLRRTLESDRALMEAASAHTGLAERGVVNIVGNEFIAKSLGTRETAMALVLASCADDKAVRDLVDFHLGQLLPGRLSRDEVAAGLAALPEQTRARASAGLRAAAGYSPC